MLRSMRTGLALFCVFLACGARPCRADYSWLPCVNPGGCTYLGEMGFNRQGEFLAVTNDGMSNYTADVLISTDQGATWTGYSLGLPTVLSQGTQNVTGITSDSGGYWYLAMENYGVFRRARTEDAWQKVSTTGAGCFSNIVAAPSGTLYVCRELGDASAILRSTDHGQTWTPSATFSLQRFSSSFLAIDGAGRIFVAGHDGSGAVLYCSDDQGATWRKTFEKAGVVTFANLAVSAAGTILVACVDHTSGASDPGLFRSTDHGATWNKTYAEDAARVAVMPDHSIFLLSTNSLLSLGKILVSLDDGLTWSPCETGLPANKNMMRTLAANPWGTLYIGSLGWGLYRLNQTVPVALSAFGVE